MFLFKYQIWRVTFELGHEVSTVSGPVGQQQVSMSEHWVYCMSNLSQSFSRGLSLIYSIAAFWDLASPCFVWCFGPFVKLKARRHNM